MLDFKYGINNFIKWFPIIWWDRNYDYEYLLDILKFKLDKMAKAIEESYIGWEKDFRRMRICVNLIDRIKKDKFDKRYRWYFEELGRYLGKYLFRWWV